MSASSRIVFSLGIFILAFVVSLADYSKEKTDSYHGLIREDAKEGDEVELDRRLVAKKDKNVDGEICGYTLYKSFSELPFKVTLLDRKDGSAKIVLAPGYNLDYERRYKYSFDVAAHDCSTGTHTDRQKVYIEVQDVDEFPPRWKEDMYIAEVEEGAVFDQILHLETEDEDGSSELSRICRYHLLSRNVPFKISSHGYLANTKPLDYSEKHNYILEVTAEDCGGLISDKIMVNIAVKEKCKLGWNGIPDEVVFTPGSGTELLAESASLNFCDTDCPSPTVTANLGLGSELQPPQCDRDTYSLQAQRRVCGASPDTVDLLPNPTLGSWDKTPKENQNSDQTFSFDGASNAIEIQPDKVDSSLSNTFAISMWMKHEGSEQDKRHEGVKQHVLCNSDGEYHNRHHYAVFVHNCRLVLLLRREPGEHVDLNQFKPAEWRWDSPQVCDNEWHHYTINVDFPEVHLHVDGRRTIENEDNPVIVDDWPLHPSKKIMSKKLVVGACWHGGDKKMSLHFKGELAGLTMLKGNVQPDHVVQCLSDCQEKLDFHDMEDLETGMSVSMNSDMTHIMFNGHNKSYIERLIRHVGYKNSRIYPSPGRRSVNLQTHVLCSDGKELAVPDVPFNVLVAQPEKPTMRLMGSDQISYSEDAIARGVAVLADIGISSNTGKDKIEDKQDMQATIDEVDTLSYQLDSCVIRADPQLNLNKEDLTYPRNMVTAMGLEVSANDEGLIIAGADLVKHYEQVLQAIHYVHSTPETLNTRHFVVSCTELNGRFVSNDYEVQLNVIHKEHVAANPPPPAHHQESIAYHQIQDVQIKTAGHPQAQASKGVMNNLAAGAATGTGVGMIVIIVVCVGFLMFMIVLGVIRIRSAQQHRREVTVDDKPEMEWDNSALTITVNPMDTGNAYDEEAGVLRCVDSESDDDDISISHDDIDTSEDEGVVKEIKDRDLEWDDSTLTF